MMCTLFLSCVNDSLTGGNSSETTNVAVVSITNEPAFNAKVSFIDAENWAYLVSKGISPVLDSTITDQNGMFSISSIPQKPCNLQIDHPDCGILIRDFTLSKQNSSDTIRLQHYGKIHGTCSDTTTIPTQVRLEGTKYTTPVLSDGKFYFFHIPPGKFPAILKSSSGDLAITRALSLEPGQHLITDTLVTSFSRLLIDDFYDGDSVSIPGEITGGAWYQFVDTSEGGFSHISHQIQPDGSIGKMITADIILYGRAQGAWAGVGVTIGRKDETWDLSKVTGISFMARGIGVIRVSLESAVVDSINTWPHFGYVFALNTAWTRYTIPVDSLSLFEYTAAHLSGITWKDAATKIMRIEFEASSIYHNFIVENVSMNIKDLYLEGISGSDIFLQMER